MMKVLGQKNTM